MLGTIARFALATVAGLALGVVATHLADNHRRTGELFA